MVSKKSQAHVEIILATTLFIGFLIFAFEFRKLDNGDNGIIDDFSVEKKIPGSVDVISKDFPVRVINERAEISELILNIKVWS